MRIISGSHRGKSISFNNKLFGNADVTSEKIKEALFSILGNDLSGHSFLDLFSCSGQMGLEALSRGCSLAAFNEKDKKRYAFISRLVRDWGLEEKSLLFNLPAAACIKLLARWERKFDYIFIDPPYVKVKAKVDLYKNILETEGLDRILGKDGHIIIQHYVHNVLDPHTGAFSLIDHRVYGTSALSIYNYL